jgi:curved DNA-binding protein CbpA
MDLRSALAHLGLSWPVDEDGLRTTYRRLALQHHPDRGGNHGDFVRVQGAYEAVLAALRSGEWPRGWQNYAGGRTDETKADESYEAFAAGFMRSRKGNLWREWRDSVLTIYGGRYGGFSYCIKTDSGPRFAGEWFDSRSAAMSALWQEAQDL